MFNRWVRFLIAVVAISAAGAAAYFVVAKEQQLARERVATESAGLAIESALVTLAEIKATLHAYVAPGQGLPFWVARSGVLLDKLRGTLIEIDPTAAAAGVALTESLDACDQLAATEQRIREHMRAGQPLLAGEAIFNDSRDQLDGMRLQLVRARDHILVTSGSRLAAQRQEQVWFLAGAAGILAFCLLLLVPVPRVSDITALLGQADAPAEPVIAQMPPPQTEYRSAPSAPDLASLCGDIARISDPAELAPLLERLRAIIDATGIIVWLAPPEGEGLYPVASAGYDQRVVAKIGSIPRDASNLTAAAFRAGAAKTSGAEGKGGAALAVPLPAPAGPVGVLSAELKGPADVDSSRLAAAEIVAAELAMVIGQVASNETRVTRSQG